MVIGQFNAKPDSSWNDGNLGRFQLDQAKHGGQVQATVHRLRKAIAVGVVEVAAGNVSRRGIKVHGNTRQLVGTAVACPGLDRTDPVSTLRVFWSRVPPQGVWRGCRLIKLAYPALSLVG